MPRLLPFLAALLLAACTRPPPPPPPLADRLLSNLPSRRQWPSNAVKIGLANPTVSTTLNHPDGRPILVHAWPRNSNDYNTPMLRLDRGPLLFAITEAEFNELQAATAPR